MSLNFIPYILMKGRGEEAIKYYQENLGAVILFKQSFGEGPKEEVEKLQKEELTQISHSVLKIGENRIMIADSIPEIPFKEGNQVSLCLTTSNIRQARDIFEKLKKEGEVLIEFSEIYFSPGYGMVKDKFGVIFQIYTNRE
ncbi:VOC family protein [Clostridium polynesiense]|uniref:VOC family protein n=1 Tax=Clostridium polynesiense TaxID=1325933 RepID=UPI00058D9A8C|nr:VOC family protein [Clostridium polynesiense]